MVMRTRPLALSLAVGCWGCGDLLHSTQWDTQCKDVLSSCDAGGGGGNGGGSASSTGPGAGSSGSATAVSVGSSGTSSTSSGGAGGCGDGSIGAGEECDDGNALPGDGCEGCVVVCAGAGEVKDPSTAHCYRADPGVADAWAGARASCVAWGGDLAAIGSDAEQTLLGGFLATSSWLGGTDAALEGSFVWSNGELLSYTHWNPGEPNDANADEDCVQIYGPEVTTAPLLWNDINCAIVMAYVCERPPPGS